jgi:hypothetical protein
MEHVQSVHSFTFMELRPLAYMVGETWLYLHRAERPLRRYNPVNRHGLSIVNDHTPSEPYKIQFDSGILKLFPHQPSLVL